jgi:hypothetical protein
VTDIAALKISVDFEAYAAKYQENQEIYDYFAHEFIRSSPARMALGGMPLSKEQQRDAKSQGNKVSSGETFQGLGGTGSRWPRVEERILVADAAGRQDDGKDQKLQIIGCLAASFEQQNPKCQRDETEARESSEWRRRAFS